MHPRPQAALAPLLRPRDQPGPHSIPSMYRKTVNRWSPLCTGKLLNRDTDDRIRRSGARLSNTSHACVCASQRKKAVTWPSASGQTAKCQWIGQDAIGQERIGCRWCASIMTRWNASKSVSLPKRCSLPTDRFSTWYTCPPGAFRAAVGMGCDPKMRSRCISLRLLLC